MQLLIMSDTHGDAGVIEKVKSFYPTVDAVIHCGDSELQYDHPVLEGIEKVRGNCDRNDDRFPNELLLEYEGVKILATHGHLYNVKSSLLTLMFRARELDVHICCFGHSHILGAELIDETLFINPGSLTKPRKRIEKSFVLLEVTEKQFIVQCYDDSNVLLDAFTFERP